MINRLFFEIEFFLFKILFPTILFSTDKSVLVVFVAYSESCERLLKNLSDFFSEEQKTNTIVFRPHWWKGKNDQFSGHNCLLTVMTRIAFKNVKFVFALNSHPIHHSYGYRMTKFLNKKAKVITIQHSVSKKDSLEELRLSLSDQLFVWDEIALNYLSPREARIIGNLELQSSFYPSNASKNIILIATCTHAEYLSDEEHRRYFEELLKLFSGYEIVIKPHPAEKFRHSFYKSLIRDFSEKYGINAQFIPDFQLNNRILLLVTRSSSIAELSAYFGIPLFIFDLYENGPADVFDSNGFVLSHSVKLSLNQLKDNSFESILREARSKKSSMTYEEFQNIRSNIKKSAQRCVDSLFELES